MVIHSRLLALCSLVNTIIFNKAKSNYLLTIRNSLFYTFYSIFYTSFSNEKNGLKTKNNKKQSRCPNPKVRK